MTVIAMPRELATCGKDVALGVAERLGLEVVYRELVEHDIAERMDADTGAVHRFLEGTPSLLDRWKIDPQKLLRCTAQEMLELADKGNILIRGWGAVTLLRKVPHVVCLRVCAPMNFRVKVLMDRLDLKSASVARREIIKNDRAHLRSAESRNVFNWTNSENFDLTLNTERVPIADCIEQATNLATSDAFAETSASKQMLSDMLAEIRIRNTFSLRREANVVSHDPDFVLKPKLRPKRTT